MIRTARLELRLPQVGDAAAIARFYAENRAHLEPWSPAWSPALETEAFWRQQAAEAAADAEARRGLRLYAYAHEEPGKVAGNVNLSAIVWGALRQCFVGYSLAEAAQGRGYAREMVGAAVDHAFEELGLHRVAANYMPHNRRSAAVLRDLGFRIEGYATAYLAINGRWEDHILTARINPRSGRSTV